MKPSDRDARFGLAIAVLLASGWGHVSAAAADTEAGARKHAHKANTLAAKNKCKAAIPEFNRAYKTLKDPTLLFNRAECQRKLEMNADALKDYEQFLADMPDAPNRAVVEARIAALRASSGPPPQAAVAAAAEKAPAAPPARPSDKLLAAPALTPPASAAKPTEKPADKTLAVPALVAPAGATKPTDRPAAAPAAPAPPADKAPVAPAAKPAAKPASPPAKEVPAVSPAKPAEKAPAEPVRRAEKWID